MQNNTNALNELLQVANELPDASSGGGECNATQDFFVDTNGIHSIALDGTLTLLNIEDLDDASDNSFMEYCRTNIFQMGGVNNANYPDSANPGRQGARGRFLFGDYGSNTTFIGYLYNAIQGNIIDSMIVECIGGPGTSGAECTMIADIYTVNAQHYHLQICCKGGTYNTDGWQLVSYGSSSGSSGLTLFSTWTGETNAGGLVMSQNCIDSKLYLVHLGYQIPDSQGGGYTFGQGIFRASGESGKFSWAKIELLRDSSDVYETLFATWCPSLGDPDAIQIVGYSNLSDANVNMCNLYQLN